jgi:hypothetical protein
LAEQEGVEVRFSALPSAEGIYSPGKPVIVVSSLRPAGRQAYTGAHELGHHIYGHGEQFDELVEDRGKSRKWDPKEYEANCFASALLMPKTAVLKGLSLRGWNLKSISPEQAYRMASWLGVGYRYHDVFHLAYAAVLGWSPVLRQLMTCKRRSNQAVDSVEDGGRAIAIEEGISALVFGYASQHAFLEGLDHVDYGILRTIKELTNHLEVSECSEHQWQSAILQGFSVWRQLQAQRRGVVVGAMDSRSFAFEPCL